MTVAKPLRITFDKVDGMIRDDDGSKRLVLFGPGKYDAIFNRIKYQIGLKHGITYNDNFNHIKIKYVSDDLLL